MRWACVPMRGQLAIPFALTCDGVAVTRTYEVRARWQAITGLTEIDRLQIRGHTLKINSIRNLDEADRVAVIDCTEVV